MSKIYTTDNVKISSIIQFLNDDGVVIFPTDTIYALACNAGSEKAVKQIFEIKKRDEKKAVSVFAPSVDFIKNVTKMNEESEKIIENFIPGAITAILETDIEKAGISPFCNPMNNNIGFRIPENDFCLRLLKEFNGPIVATSVNLSGFPSIHEINDISEEICEQVSLIVDAGKLEKLPSTVIDLTGEKFRILRKGAISEQDILSII